ncbi:ArsR/SmtB family transcription factor [Paenibacillus sp. GCM10012307]|uniref:Winged helix-turn-helix transcriptional regulator n=1 Tax=Paenibacillus roseus TaxID=2798579 RepID=A0A934MS91_9BACL|nr:metalloregulator ArsR/SmtB family transcription factor [Paenibacillus roseus]MBJ6363054.1 winged helix-turn-helix transcriptional regulator [Paenibacillus roseus]
MDTATDTLDKMAETFKLLGDRTRLAILGLLREKELCVCNIVDILHMSQPSISQHLRKMKAGGLVHERRQGKWTYYSLKVEDKPYIQQIVMEIPSQASKLKELDGPSLSTVSCD